MIRPELGTKCTCSGCGERYYDLTLPTATCPKCGEARVVRPPRVARPTRKPAEMLRFGARARPAAEEPETEAEVEAADDADDEADDDDIATLTPDATEDEDATDDLEREVVRPGPVD